MALYIRKLRTYIEEYHSYSRRIKALKPTDYGAVEIRYISGHFYVYEIFSRWDPAKEKARKVTGKSAGKITLKDGFIPNEYGNAR